MTTEIKKQGLLIAMALKMGLHVRLRVGGRSMTPSILSRSWVVVRPRAENEIPTLGTVVMLQATNSPRYIVHRVISSNGEQITTQGDSNLAPDEPVHYSRIVGIVASRELFGRRLAMRPNAWSRWILRHPTAAHKLNHLIANVLHCVAGLALRRREEETAA